MRTNTLFSVVSLVLATLATALTGCVPDLPDTLDVAISSTEKINAPRGSGPEILADSSWSVFRKPDPGDAGKAVKGEGPSGPYGGSLTGGLIERLPVNQQMFIAEFGATGSVAGIRENDYLLPDIYGEQIPVAQTWTGTTLPFVSYRSASYGVNEGSRYGLAIDVQVKLGPVFVGHAILYNWGTVDEGRLDGTFGNLFDFSEGIGGLLFETGGDQFPFYGNRLE